MALPEDLKRTIDEIKTPSNRLLVKCFIIAVTGLCSALIYIFKDGDNSKDSIIKAKQEQIDDMKEQRSSLLKTRDYLQGELKECNESEAERIKSRLTAQKYTDSITQTLNKIKKK